MSKRTATVQVSGRIVSNEHDEGFDGPFVLTQDYIEVEVPYSDDEDHFDVIERAFQMAGSPRDWTHGVGWQGRWRGR